MLILRGPLTIGKLAERLGIERTTLSRNLALIESAAWATVQPGDDARARVVAVTAKGHIMVAASLGAWRKGEIVVADSTEIPRPRLLGPPSCLA